MTVHAPRATNLFVGSPIERIEDLRFLTGRGEYVDDVTRDGLLHAAIVRSSVAHGRIRSVDVSKALARPGVHAVITAADIGETIPLIPMRQEPLPEFKRFEQPVIAHGKVRYVGEPIAVVIADSAGVAEDAIDDVLIDIEHLPPIPDRDAARRDEVLLFEEIGSNRAGALTAVKGDADAAFRDAPYTRRERFTVQRHTGVPMEPRGFLADWDSEKQELTVCGASKVPFPNRRILAKHMGLPESAIHMVENDVGGGFGVKGEFYPEEFLIPFAARLLSRPVKWIEDRREHLLTCNHARDVECELEIACTRDGTILGIRGEAIADVGAYIRTNGVTPARNVAQVLTGAYRIPNIHLSIVVVLTSKTPVGTYRGPGRFEADFFRERLFDMAAADLGIDRVEFRRRNLISEQEMPYSLARVAELELDTQTDSGDYQVTFERCLQEIDWSGKAQLQGQLIEGRYHGLGIGCYIEGGASGPRENVRIVLESDGRFAIYVGSSAVGQGLETVFSQIAADALEVPMERIRGVFHGSTDYLKEGFGTYSSRSVVMGGSAIVAGAGTIRGLMIDAAAKELGCEPNQVRLEPGLAIGPNGKEISWRTLAEQKIFADGTYASHHRTYSYGTHAAHVAVDPKTGHVQVLNYIAVEDVGRIINPATLHGQAVGAIVQGLGGVFLEHLVYDPQGQLLTGSLADYLMPLASDFPTVDAVALEEKPAPHNPLGAKGAGEGGIIPVAGVIGNAVANALSSCNVQPRDLPLSPPRVWELINGR
jgi:carbon-monoxide dehydrogenase large subunit